MKKFMIKNSELKFSEYTYICKISVGLKVFGQFVLIVNSLKFSLTRETNTKRTRVLKSLNF